MFFAPSFVLRQCCSIILLLYFYCSFAPLFYFSNIVLLFFLRSLVLFYFFVLAFRQNNVCVAGEPRHGKCLAVYFMFIILKVIGVVDASIVRTHMMMNKTGVAQQ